jgi:hypothetical protein
VEVLPDVLRVESFAPTASGFEVRFNRAIDAGVVNLYSGEPLRLGPADVVVTGPAGRRCAGRWCWMPTRRASRS